MSKNIFGDIVHTAYASSYPNIENKPVFGRPIKGFVSAYDTPEDGFVNWKAVCAVCEKFWGEWERVDTQWLTTFPIPKSETMERVVKSRLLDLGFSLSPHGTVVCPPCNGRSSPLRCLNDGVPPQSTQWYSERL